jgi:hypothetical protein
MPHCALPRSPFLPPPSHPLRPPCTQQDAPEVGEAGVAAEDRHTEDGGGGAVAAVDAYGEASVVAEVGARSADAHAPGRELACGFETALLRSTVHPPAPASTALSVTRICAFVCACACVCAHMASDEAIHRGEEEVGVRSEHRRFPEDGRGYANEEEADEEATVEEEFHEDDQEVVCMRPHQRAASPVPP